MKRPSFCSIVNVIFPTLLYQTNLVIVKIVAMLAVMAVSSSALAVPIVFERNYKNEAWGHQDSGCFIDESRYVYIYDSQLRLPVRLVTQMSEEAFQRANSLLKEVAGSPYRWKSVAVDAGSTIYVGRMHGEMIRIKEYGNIIGSRVDARTDRLIEIIEGFCPRY